MSDPPKRNRGRERERPGPYRWAVQVFFLAIVLSAALSLASETSLSGAGAAAAALVLAVFIGLGILFDIIGVAVTAADPRPFHSMAAHKEPGAKEALVLLRNAGRVSSVCNDVVGDIFDRGPRADIILDSLLDYHSVDIQWGNHDVLWMGAASGSRTLVATVLANSLRYNNLEVIETGYGISLRPLSVFANEVYRDTDVTRFSVKLTGEEAERYTEKDKLLSARMYKAITMILFKLEGQKILRNPDFGMADRLLLDKIDYESRTVTVDGRAYPMLDTDFPTVNPADPYALTPEEEILIHQLTLSFLHSEKLQRHVRFLYSKGSLYKIFNGNLLFHGCIPMAADGSLLSFPVNGGRLSGKAFLDYADLAARRAYYSAPGLLPQVGHPGAAAGHGLPLVPLGRTQQPHLRPRPHDHL